MCVCGGGKSVNTQYALDKAGNNQVLLSRLSLPGTVQMAIFSSSPATELQVSGRCSDCPKLQFPHLWNGDSYSNLLGNRQYSEAEP